MQLVQSTVTEQAPCAQLKLCNVCLCPVVGVDILSKEHNDDLVPTSHEPPPEAVEDSKPVLVPQTPASVIMEGRNHGIQVSLRIWYRAC